MSGYKYKTLKFLPSSSLINSILLTHLILIKVPGISDIKLLPGIKQ